MRDHNVKIGVIADTHGLLRTHARQLLTGCDLIIHAGDIGKPEVIEALEALAHVEAIRGNVDKWAHHLPEEKIVTVGGRKILVTHDINSITCPTDDFDVVISGHSHRPVKQRRGNTLFLNPGSAGPRRFSLPVMLAKLYISKQRLAARHFTVSIER